MGNKQIKEEDQLTDSDAVCPSQFGANNKQNQEENRLTERLIRQILDNKQMNLEYRLAVSVRGMWLVQNKEQLKDENRLADAVAASLSQFQAMNRQSTYTNLQMQSLHL